MHHSDERLIAQFIVTRDERLFTQLYQRYYRKVYASCFRFMKEEEEARDQVQEIFGKVFTRLHTFRGQSSFATWLFVLTRHQCFSARDQAKRYRFFSLDAATNHYDFLQEESSMEDRWIQAQLALHRLPLRDQQLLERRYLGNQSIEQLAIDHGLTQSAVKMRLKRARDQARLLGKGSALCLA
ncbi:RNA polymerase sigma factor [Fibrella forsythiae]|uniref:Sigma-70 family RNA polymerase sigma factor n=1 Tax=Fibrella forsythiae TaxID=2817061 RepID=A0ABS3JWD1_9BACT|nr:sigma-70 family RNA polymerase sigma factor [Fibrella forsythiae]MBO0953207.1 sigma-70 family RNA polymerase sigma factor [Fibrella forsythiae]